MNRTKLSRKRRKPASVPSASDGVNELLRLAMIQEQYERLEAEAAEFHADPEGDRPATKAFQKASLRTLGRD